MKALILNLEDEDIVILYKNSKELEEKLQAFIDKGIGTFYPKNMKLKVI